MAQDKESLAQVPPASEGQKRARLPGWITEPVREEGLSRTYWLAQRVGQGHALTMGAFGSGCYGGG